MKRICSIAVLLLFLLSLCGCRQKGPVYSGEKTGTTCANITMGGGMFAYGNGFVYYCDTYKYIYEYDIDSKKTVRLEMDDVKGMLASNLFLSQDYIFYGEDKVLYMSKDGKEKGVLYTPKTFRCLRTFADGQDLFYIDGLDGNLYHGNLTTGEETTLARVVNGYYVDDNSIYVIAKEDGDVWQLFVSGRNEFRFTPVELSFVPIAVVADGDALYLSKQGSWQIIKYQDGKETEYPIQSWYYQVLGDAIYYLDKNEFKNSCYTLKKYDMNTGKITHVCNMVFRFCILEGRYVCCDVWGDESGCYLIDLETGTKEKM